MPRKRKTNGRPYRRKRARVLREGRVCAICGLPIRFDKKAPHPLSPSVHHPEPVSLGAAELGPMVPAHLGCNKRRGNRGAPPAEDRSASW